jgi:carbamoyl-phosphate synthase small subunit
LEYLINQNIKVDQNANIAYPTSRILSKEILLMAIATATQAHLRRSNEQPTSATCALVLADESIFWGTGLGIEGITAGEFCFNTSMTGYQEIITDPSYADQIITFTFPHIGNIGTNDNDLEHNQTFAKGIVLRADVTDPSNYRATETFNNWLTSIGLIGICGIDTREIAKKIRTFGAVNGVICHAKNGHFNIDQLTLMAQNYKGLEGRDLAKSVTCDRMYTWNESTWKFGGSSHPESYSTSESEDYHVVAIDYGAKKNILRNLSRVGCKVTVVPAITSADTILELKPDGVFLSNGPGDPAATASHAVPTIRALLKSKKPIFGICLGHQLLALALGARTKKMKVGHRGANHPVKNLLTGKIEITSQNHGFIVSEDNFPTNLQITHRSLFDGSIEGFRLANEAVFSVQYHPEASPGPSDSEYLFENFIQLIREVNAFNHA